MNKQQLRSFVKRRNDSSFSSNLQFQIDADGCGFKVSELGDPTRIEIDSWHGYQWTTPHGRLIEFGNRMYLEGDSKAAQWPATVRDIFTAAKAA